MKKQRYAVVVIKYVEGKRAAQALQAQFAAYDHVSKLLPVARYDERCPKGSDHAHARYDGAKYCRSCGQYLSVEISKSEGWARR